MPVPSASPVPDPTRTPVPPAPPLAASDPLGPGSIPPQLDVLEVALEPSAPPPSVRPAAALRDGALRGLGWMLVANVLFAAMTIVARMASQHTSWMEVGMARAGV